jgi:ATP-dependent DNA ligase
MIATITPPTYPARPINGGRLDIAPKKRGTWFYEPKYNGWRVLVHTLSGTCFNRHGKELSISDEFQPALDQLRKLPFHGWLDCEGLERRHGIGRGTLIVFDILIKSLGYEDRKNFLNSYLPTLTSASMCEEDQVYASPSLSDGPDIMKAWEIMQTQNQSVGCEFYEGFVAKKKDSPYPYQLDSPSKTTYTWMKHRFIN